jgi:invasion protein IalB
MTAEPIFIAQIEQDPSLHRAWFDACTQQAKQKGCTFGRYSVHEDNERLALAEGWVDRPDAQGEQRWSLVAS